MTFVTTNLKKLGCKAHLHARVSQPARHAIRQAPPPLISQTRFERSVIAAADRDCHLDALISRTERAGPSCPTLTLKETHNERHRC